MYEYPKLCNSCYRTKVLKEFSKLLNKNILYCYYCGKIEELNNE